MSTTRQGSPLPRVDIVRDKTRVTAVYIDQFALRGVRSISVTHTLNQPAVVSIEMIADDVIMRDVNAGGIAPVSSRAGDTRVDSYSVDEGALLIGSDTSE